MMITVKRLMIFVVSIKECNIELEPYIANIPYSQKICWGIKFGGLAVYLCNHQIKIHQYFILVYTLTKPPNLNPPIFLQWRFGGQLPNLIPANISVYMVYLRNTDVYMNQ